MKRKALAAIAVATTAAAPAASMADLSANVGWNSEYIYRGVYQEDSSASGGLDYETGGFYAGTWGADVGNGLEIDLYFGYGGELDIGSGLGWSVGWTGYYYTEDDPDTGFYDTITEVNLGISYGMFSVDHAVGEEDGWGFPTDFTFTEITLSPDFGPYFTYGAWGDEYDGEYLELGYEFSAMDLDFNVALTQAINNNDPNNVIYLENWNEVFNNGSAKTAFTFGVSKSIDLSGD